ncbi:MAG: EthD domain [Actinomycetota bacterium]|jgi:uncharacterized protein (TIGR02118 family)
MLLVELRRGATITVPGVVDRVLADGSGMALPEGVALGDRAADVEAIVHVADAAELPSDAVRWFRVESTVQLDGPDLDGPKLLFFFGGRRSLSHDEVIAHWRDVHGPLALHHHVGMSRYVQHEVVEGSDDRVDAIAELHFANAHDLAERFYDSDDGRRAIAADIASFAGRYSETFLVERQRD